MLDVTSVSFESFAVSVPAVLDACGASEFLAAKKRVLLKPNLVMAAPPPVTTPPDCVEAVIAYVRAHSSAVELVVAEGTGCGLDTAEVFERLGYNELAARLDVYLLDLNNAPLVRVENPSCKVFPDMWLPEIAFTHAVVSIPVLKAHSLCGYTGTIKNMMGFAPPAHYGSIHAGWKKAKFHAQIDECLRDLNRYVSPALTVIDASIGLAKHQHHGPECNPPVGRLLAGSDPIALDREAAGLLGLDWHTIGHLK